MKRWMLSVLCFSLLSIGALAASTPHSITVNWTYTQGADLATGFNVYRGTAAGGPYTKLNAAPVPVATLTYIDTSGAGGTTYFYVVTAADAAGFESAFSNEASGIMLQNPAVPQGVTVKAQ